MKTKRTFSYDSRIALLQDFIWLHSSQFCDRENSQKTFAKQRGVSIEQIENDTFLDSEFIDFYLKLDSDEFNHYGDFLHQIPFGDLVMIEKIIGKADFDIKHGQVLTLDSAVTYNKKQRWTVLQHIANYQYYPAQQVESFLEHLLEKYTKEQIEAILYNITPPEYRNDDEWVPEQVTASDRPLEQKAFTGYAPVEGHGDHWDAVYGNVDMVSQKLPQLIQDSKIRMKKEYSFLDDGEKSGPAIAFGLACPTHGEVKVFCLNVSFRVESDGVQVWSCYPVMDRSLLIDLQIIEILEWENGLEAQIRANTAWGAAVGFFAPHYFAHKEYYQVGQTVPVKLSALAYSIQHSSIGKINITDQIMLKKINTALGEDKLPVNFRISELMTIETTLMARVDNKVADDLFFHGVIESIAETHCDDVPFFCYDIYIFEDYENERPYNLPVYVKQSLMAAEPPLVVGDQVEGFLWIQGIPQFDDYIEE